MRVLIFIVAICLASVASYGQQKEIKFQFSVLDDKNEAYRDLKPYDLRILVNNKAVQPKSFNTVNDRPLKVLILVDASISQETMLPFEKQAAEYLIDHILTPGRDSVGIVKFTGTVSLVQDLTNDFATAKLRLKEIQIELPAGYIGGGAMISRGPPVSDKNQVQAGSTSVFESVSKTLSALAKVDAKGGRKIILLLSDGVNTSGENKVNPVVEASIKNDVPIYAVGIGDEFYSGIDQKSLKKLTEPTGGLFVMPNKKFTNLPEMMKRVENSLRFRYEVIIPDAIGNGDKLTETLVEIVNPQLKGKKLQIIQQKGIFMSN